MRKLLTAVVVVALIAGLVYAYLRWVDSTREKPRVIPVTTVTNTTIISGLEQNGSIKPRNELIVKSEVNGRVESIFVADGEVVTSGQVLVELDKIDLLNRRRELDLDRREALLQLEGAQLDYSRNYELYQAQLVSPDVFDRMRIERDLKSNRVDKICSQITTVDDNLRKTTISAPSRGTIYNRAIEIGEVVVGASSVSSGTEMMKLADLEVLEVRALVDETDIASIVTNMPVAIAVESLRGHAFNGVVDRIAPAATIDKQSQQPLGFEVTVLLDARNTQLKPGMTATIQFTLGVASNAVALPLSAVYCDNYEVAPADQEFYVFAKTNTQFVKLPVEVGLHDLRYIQILSDITTNYVIALERPPANDLATAAEAPSERRRGTR